VGKVQKMKNRFNGTFFYLIELKLRLAILSIELRNNYLSDLAHGFSRGYSANEEKPFQRFIIIIPVQPAHCRIKF